MAQPTIPAEIFVKHKEAWVAGEFEKAAALCAEARSAVESVDPAYTVVQNDDGTLAVAP